MLICLFLFYYHSERVPGDGEDDSDDYIDEDDVIDNLDDDYESGSDDGNYWFFVLIILWQCFKIDLPALTHIFYIKPKCAEDCVIFRSQKNIDALD